MSTDLCHLCAFVIQLPAGVVSIDTLAFSIDRGTGVRACQYIDCRMPFP